MFSVRNQLRSTADNWKSAWQSHRMHPDALQILYETAEKTKSDIIVCKAFCVNETADHVSVNIVRQIIKDLDSDTAND